MKSKLDLYSIHKTTSPSSINKMFGANINDIPIEYKVYIWETTYSSTYITKVTKGGTIRVIAPFTGPISAPYYQNFNHPISILLSEIL